MPSIKEVFDNPRTTSRNPATLAARAGVSRVAAAAFLRDQAASQIRKKATKPPEADYSPTGGARGEWLADVIYLREYAGVNSARECILTLLGVNSRYVYARALTKATSAKTAEALTEILEQNAEDAQGGVVAPIQAIRSDGGPEFSGEFSALLLKRGIQLEKGQPGTHARLGRLDRYHGVLRGQIGQLFAARNSHVWADTLQDLADNHNTIPSRALNAAGRGSAPADIGPDEEELLRAYDLSRAAALRRRVDSLGIEAGVKVRLLTSALKNAPKFVKGQEATWTPELYTVLGRAGSNTFRIEVPPSENAVWPFHAIQVVKKSLGQAKPAGAKVIKKVVAAKRMEALNISEGEAAAALAAPAATKRVSKPTPKMAALAADSRPAREKKRPAKLLS